MLLALYNIFRIIYFNLTTYPVILDNMFNPACQTPHPFIHAQYLSDTFVHTTFL